MATRKLKNFEFAGLQNTDANDKAGLTSFDNFETPNGFVFLVSGSVELLEETQQICEVINERVRYYLDNEVLDDPKEAVRNALVYANGFVFERSRKEPEFRLKDASVLCLLVRDEKVFYAWMGDVSLFLYTGKRRYPLTWDLKTEAGSDALKSEDNPLLFLGENQLAEPAVCEQPLVPVDGDMLFLGTGSLWNNIREKVFCTVLADSMPTHTKVQRVIKMAAEMQPETPIAAQLVSFYNLDQTERSFVAGKSTPAPSVFERIQSKMEEKPKSSLAKSLIIALGVVILAYMFWDMFLNNPARPVRVSAPTEAISESDTLDDAADQTNAALAFNAVLPADVEYTVKSGDTWGRIYQQYEVCSWFIRNHQSNAGKFDSDDNPVSNTTLVIPIRYSASRRLNPDYFQEFTTDKVGNACQNANEAFKKRFDEKVRSAN
jgi:serine/threonine protein phosphatase PrpC